MKTWLLALMATVAVLGCDSKTETRKPASVRMNQAASAPATSAATTPLQASSADQSGTPDWVKVEGKANASVTVYLDAASAVDEEGHRKVWILFDHQKDEDYGGRSVKHRSSKRLSLYSCQDKKSASREDQYYKEGMGRGVAIFNQKFDTLKWFPAPANSLAEATMNAACKLSPKVAAHTSVQSATQAPASPWKLAGDIPGGKIYLNESTLTVFGKYKKVSTLRDYDAQQSSTNQKKYLSVNAFDMFSCSDRKYWVGAPRFHTGKMGGGEKFAVESKLTLEDIPSDGGVAAIFKLACG